MYASRAGGGMYTPETRLVARSVWNTLFFVFNGALFILLGLQLRSIFAELAIFPARTLLEYGLGISATVILVRLAWVFATSRVRRMVDRGVAEREGEMPPLSWTFVLGWAGMRGIVSLAAALSLPDTVAGGAPFPARDLILFVTFAVILVTLLGQGLTLPLVLRRFAIVEGDGGDAVIAKARVRIAEAALRRLAALESGFTSTVHWEIAGRLQGKYADDAVHFRAHMDGALGTGDAAQHEIERFLVREAIGAERSALNDLRYAGEITDDVFRRIQYDIDLAETRLLS
jgi:CPA1 family monovalent cation:H+ antiporter